MCYILSLKECLIGFTKRFIILDCGENSEMSWQRIIPFNYLKTKENALLSFIGKLKYKCVVCLGLMK